MTEDFQIAGLRCVTCQEDAPTLGKGRGPEYLRLLVENWPKMDAEAQKIWSRDAVQFMRRHHSHELAYLDPRGRSRPCLGSGGST